jgi:hypothetical protein
VRGGAFTRRCGCGAVIGVRESCAACASRQRAELHARGLAVREGRRPEDWFVPGAYEPTYALWSDETRGGDALRGHRRRAGGYVALWVGPREAV